MRRGRLETCQRRPQRLAGPTYPQGTTVARLGPRADATGRSTSGAKIDVLSGGSAGTRNVERGAQTGELERSQNHPRVWARGASAWDSNWQGLRYVAAPHALGRTVNLRLPRAHPLPKLCYLLHRALRRAADIHRRRGSFLRWPRRPVLRCQGRRSDPSSRRYGGRISSC